MSRSFSLKCWSLNPAYFPRHNAITRWLSTLDSLRDVELSPLLHAHLHPPR
jgi:hypothetical protein